MKLYIDNITWKELLGILWGLPRSLYRLIKEEIYWWLVLYPFEAGHFIIDEDAYREKCLRKSRRRMKHWQRNVTPRG